jgi:hypothetical protein
MSSLLHPTAYQLGDLLSTYRYSRSAAIWLGIRLVLILFGGLILLGAWSASPNADLRFLGGVGLLWIILSTSAIVEWRRKHAFQVAVYQAGLIYTLPREVIAIRWEEISTVIQQHARSTLNAVPLGMFYTFVIQTTTGRVFKLTNAVENIALLGEQIQQATFSHLWIGAFTAYQRGEIVPFGKLSISSTGLHLRQKTLLWPKLRDIMVHDGSLRVREHGKWLTWASVAVAQVTNIHVVLALIEQIASSQTSAATS